MKTKLIRLALLLALSVPPSASLLAATTIHALNRYAYGANTGWLDWRGDTNSGAVIGANFCSGNLYAANFGWVSLGSGAPTNGLQYQNLSANDFGVNVDPSGKLRGYAYGANVGWIAFEALGAPAVDFVSGNLSGYAWGANLGWISLSNAVAFVQTAPLTPPNDLCAGALALSNGVVFAQSTGPATSAGDPMPDCASSFGKGVWFTYTPDLSGVVTLSTCGSDFDTLLAVYSGSCGALTQMACDDDNGPSCANTRASLAYQGTAGVTCYILAGGYGSSSGNLSILATSPSNDQCAGALPLADAVPMVLSTTNASSVGDPVPGCQSSFSNGVWFTYTAPASGDVLVSTCGSSFDTVLGIYTGTCGALTSLACDDDNGPACVGLNASLRFPVTSGATYYLLAGGFAGARGTLAIEASLVPVLTVGTSGNNLVLTWPGGGTLQSTTNLSPVINWTNVATGGFWSEPMTNPAKFFRVAD